jgi:peptide/nickel transport system ATP-binding protein
MNVVADALEVSDLRVVRSGTDIDIVSELNFTLKPGEVLGLVGESGSGKTTAGLALLNHCRRGLVIADGSKILVAGYSLLDLTGEELRALRGPVVCYIPQDPGSALNPALRIRTQLVECGKGRERLSEARLEELLSEVKLPYSPSLLDSYPHQISGGQQQRVAIAMAFANRPRVIVMDEPTTGLDVTTQAHILEIVRQLCSRYDVAAVYISHDLSAVASLADRVAVMYAGRIVEAGPVGQVLHRPYHPYTQALIAAVPDLASNAAVHGIPGRAPEPSARPPGCSFAPRCSRVGPHCTSEMPANRHMGSGSHVRCYHPILERVSTDRSVKRIEAVKNAEPLLEITGLRARHANAEILHGIDLKLDAGQCLALVGESGSGKTTLARCVAGLHAEQSGSLLFAGEQLSATSRSRPAETRRDIQYIFQNPYASLNPRRTIGQSIAASLSILARSSRAEAGKRVEAVLRRVALPVSAADRYPHELSGGQRQRAAIARALAVEPRLLICDEITSALDVSIQAVIIELLDELKREQSLSMLFITHNLALVGSIAESVSVLIAGRIVETGPTAMVTSKPASVETRKLLENTPRLETRPILVASIPS